jgi:UDPglucose 6-dehydrogenase
MFHSINIIGYGFVGSAMGYLCKKNDVPFNVCDRIDKQDAYQFYTKEVSELVVHSEKENEINYYVIAVPTPSGPDESCDLSILKDVLTILQHTVSKTSRVIIKSTLVPGSCRRLHQEFDKLHIISCPEFLREATYQDDMYHAPFVLLGFASNKKEDMKEYENVSELFQRLYVHHSDIPIHVRTYEECELFKYTLNVHLAVKVWYFNEIYEIAEKLGVSYESLKTLFPLDSRIGEYGTRVPGPDGKFGYGLSCLPKETRGMMKLQEQLGLDNQVLRNIIQRNNSFRNKLSSM